MKTKLINLLIAFGVLISSITSIDDWETFKSSFNMTQYTILCNDKHSQCLKESLSYITKYTHHIPINPDSNYSMEELKSHSLVSHFFYQIGRIYYYGLINKTPNLPLGLTNFIISGYFGNPSAQFKLYLLLETDIFSQIISMPSFKAQLNSNHFLLKIQKTLFYNNFNVNTEKGRYTRSMQFLYSASLGQSMPALMTLGFKYLNGYGVASSCETSTKYYKEASYQSIKSKSMSNKINYYHFIQLVKYEYLESKYKMHHDNIIERIDYHKLNAQKKNIKSIQNLGLIFLFDYEGMQDYNEAFKWYKLGAELNDTESIYYLGEMYLNGWGVESKDYDKALTLFIQAASANFSLAFNSMGIMYYYGYGVEKNPKRAYDLFEKAIITKTNFTISDVYFNLLSLLIEDKNGITPNYQKAHGFAHSISIKHHTYGMYFNAMMNHYNIGSSFDNCELTLQYFKQVVEKDFESKRLYNSAFINYQSGNYKIATLMYIELAEKGFKLGQMNAAIMLRNYDIFIDKNFQKQLMFKYTKMASKSHQVHSFLLLGDFYYEGFGNVVNQDYQKAKYYYEKIIKKGSTTQFLKAHAHFNIGLMYNLGKGVEKNITHAKNHYNVAMIFESTVKYPVFIMDYYNYFSEKSFKSIIKDKIYRIISNFFNSKLQIGLASSFILFYCFFFISIKLQKS